MPPAPSAPTLSVGRYAVYDVIASGGMASVHYGRLRGPVGFTRTVAIKKMHVHLARTSEFVSMFVDEAKLAARIRHPNVVPTLDVVAEQDELFLVMEYVQGESLARLLKSGGFLPPPVAAAVMAGVLHGLHAAHEAKSDGGEPLRIVHRDVSPQNILVGADGVARVLDFGIAKASARLQSTTDGVLKGKLAYMAPEQIRRGGIDRRTDVYAAGVTLWEALVGRRLWVADNEGELLERILLGFAEAPGTVARDVPPAMDEIVMRAVDRNPERRFATAREMALALERCTTPAMPSSVGEWVEKVAGASLAARAARVAEIESWSADSGAPPPAGSTPEPIESGVRPSRVPTEVQASPSSAAEGGGTNTSSFSVSGPAAPASRPRAGARTIAIAAVAALLLGVAVWEGLHARAGAPAPVAASSSGPPAAPSVAPSSPAAPLEVVQAAPPSVSADAAAPALAAATKGSPRPPAPPRTVAATAGAGQATPAPPPPVAATATPQCDPPYTRADNGEKIWKRECLH